MNQPSPWSRLAKCDLVINMQAARTLAGATRRSFVERFQSPGGSPPERSGDSGLAAAADTIPVRPAGPPPASSSGAAGRHDSSGAPN